MRKKRKRTQEIERFILANVPEHPTDITSLATGQFAITRPAVLRYINSLIQQGLLEVQGKTRDRRYSLKLFTNQTFAFDPTQYTEEDKIWRHIIQPLLRDLPENVLHICEYGLNEMINNVIDHSEGTRSSITVRQSAAGVSFLLCDNGDGIFHKIQKFLRLDEPREAILQLAKGKLTTDPDRHSGEGIFFVSRMFDQYIIFSDGLYYTLTPLDEQEKSQYQAARKGTCVEMMIRADSNRTVKDVFDRYAPDEDYSFSRTDLPVSLARFGSENLVSRSQARRVLSRLRGFKQIQLDFNGVQSIGQAFADEIFRVYASSHPDVEITAVNANMDVAAMIRRGQSYPRR